MTAALEGGAWSAARPGRTLSHGKGPVSIVKEAGWAPGPIWTGGKSRPHWDSIPDRPARIESLYRLSYPTHKVSQFTSLNCGGIQIVLLRRFYLSSSDAPHFATVPARLVVS